MSTLSATLIPGSPHIPYLLAHPPRPHPLPRAPDWRSIPAGSNPSRTLAEELDELSDEENELEETWKVHRNRGFNFLHIIGKTSTQQEEKNDADTDTDGSGSVRSDGANSNQEDGENETGEDLDANMDDLDDDIGSDEPDENDDGEGDDDDSI